MKCLIKAGWGVPQQPTLADLVKDLYWWHVWDRPSCFLRCWQKNTVVALSIMWGEPALLSTSLPLVALRETWWQYVGSLSVNMGGMGKTGLILTLWPMVTHSAIRKNQTRRAVKTYEIPLNTFHLCSFLRERMCLSVVVRADLTVFCSLYTVSALS